MQPTIEPLKESEKAFFNGLKIQRNRRELAQTFDGFCLVYLSHYFTLEKADFHDELMDLLGDWSKQFIAIEGFRGSAKSSYASLALILWAALEGKAKFIIPINETDDVAKITIANLRQELSENEWIKNDYGSLIITTNRHTTFNDSNIVLANGCRILARSRGQKIRGLRHNQYRPDLIVGDDLEEVGKVDKIKYRDGTENWLRGTVIPAIEEFNGRMVILGNKLHTDAIMERLKRMTSVFTYRAYSLFNGEEIWENCTWKGKYPNQEAIDQQKKKVGHNMWLREYCLKVLPPEGQEVKQEWLQFYDEIPREAEYGLAGVGVDLAISKSENADYTSMVSGVSATIQGMPKIYIKPFPVHARLSFHETIETAKNMSMLNPFATFFVEEVAYQRAAIQEMERSLLPVVSMRPGTDKRARLRAVAIYIQNGTIVFPREGCEELLEEMIFFGVSEHDDLVDAFVYLILGLVQQNLQNPEIVGLI